MTELRRWSEEGATQAEVELLRAARRERPPASSRSRVLSALGAGATMLASTSAATATATATAATGGMTLATKIVGISLLVGGTAGGFAWHASHVAPSSRAGLSPLVAGGASQRPPPVSAVTDERVAAPSPALGERTARSPADEPSRAAAAPQQRAQRFVGTLSLEVATLERAKSGLRDGDADAALRALDRYRAQFPRGELSSEETVLRVEALLAKGEASKARALAADYCVGHPDSPYAWRVQELVRGAKQE